MRMLPRRSMRRGEIEYDGDVKKADLPIVEFKNVKAMETWLSKNHAKSEGIWIRMFKKETGKPSITRDEAIDAGLCYGWIDSQANPYDEVSWLQRYTPRKAKGMWSKRNVESVARLIKEKRMRAAGLAAVEAAKKDGRWDRAYDMPSTMAVPADFLAAVKKHKKAQAFFETLNKANTYAIAWRLQTAKKPETRQKRFDALLAMLKDGKKLH
jgi:uncharacterized protein YdeI (YjbR/CyaY-like superfamily)